MFFFTSLLSVLAVIGIFCWLLSKPTLKIPSRKKSLKSIEIEKLPLLLEAIRSDFPGWDSTSNSLKTIFEKYLIDPKEKYAKFYSTEDPEFPITYTWNDISLQRIAGGISKFS
jgi:hypothetical protein